MTWTTFWQFLTHLTIFEKFDNFCQIWQFSKNLTIFDKLYIFLANLTIFDNFHNFWNYFDNFWNYFDNFRNYFDNFDKLDIFDNFQNCYIDSSIQSAIFGSPKRGVLAILGVPKMALRVLEWKFWDHFSIQTSPQNPQKATSGAKIRPQKVIFCHFINFAFFNVVFPLARAVFFQIRFCSRRSVQIKKLKKTNQL